MPPLLEKLRQSILAAAFRGDLTKDWRAKHPEVEPASELLKRIRVERRRKWEEGELAGMKAKKKVPTDDKWKAKYEEPEPVDATELPELPERWCWASTEEIVRAPIAYGVVQPGPEVPGGVPFVRAMDMDDDALLLGQIRCIAHDIADAYPRTQLEFGDILLGIVRAAKVAVVPQALVDGNVVRGIARLAPWPGVVSEYIAALLASPSAQERLLAKHRGIDMPVINLADVRVLPIPLAPTAEQSIIAERVGQLRDRLRGEGAALRKLAAQADALEKAYLAAAFRGDLVPQDPNDEPAKVMLARVHGATGSTTTGGDAAAGKKSVSERTRVATYE